MRGAVVTNKKSTALLQKSVRFGKESVVINGQGYCEVKMDRISVHAWLGPSYKKMRKKELIANNQSRTLFHVVSNERFCQIFGFRNPWAAKFDFGEGRVISGAGWVNTKMDGLNQGGHTLAERGGKWEVKLTNNRIVYLKNHGT